MPVPPPAFFAGPAAAAAAKAVVYEWGPAVSSASLATLLARLAWKRLPEWIREDVAWRRSSSSNNNSNAGNIERLSTVWERIQAWMEHTSHKMSGGGGTSSSPVPHLWAAMLIYWQLCAQLEKQEEQVAKKNTTEEQEIVNSEQLIEPKRTTSQEASTNSVNKVTTRGGTEEEEEKIGKQRDHETDETTMSDTSSTAATVLGGAEEEGEEEEEEEDKQEEVVSVVAVSSESTAKPRELRQLQHMLHLATLAYYVDDEPWLREQLEAVNFDLCKCFIPNRPGLVGYYLAESTNENDTDDGDTETTAATETTTTILIGIRGTYSLEEVLTDSCGRSVSYNPGHDHRHSHHSKNGLPLSSSNHTRIEVQARQDDWIVHHEDYSNDANVHYGGGGNDDDYVVVAADGMGDNDRLYNESVEEGGMGIEIVSGHERIWMEHSHHYPASNDNDGPKKKSRRRDNHGSGGDDDDDDDDDSHADGVRCHEGIMVATQRLLKQVEPIIVERVLGQAQQTNKKKKKCRLLLVGHSLGAGAACLLAMMLRWRHPQLLINHFDDDDNDQDNNNTNLDHYHHDHRLLQVYAFAPPPCLDHDSAIAAQQYVTTVVHRSDLIPRCSLANLAVLLEVLRDISNDILIPRGMAPTGPAKTTALLRQLALGDKGPAFWTAQQLMEARTRAEQTVELRHAHHLYVPGKCYFLNATAAPAVVAGGGGGQDNEKESSSTTTATTPISRADRRNNDSMAKKGQAGQTAISSSGRRNKNNSDDNSNNEEPVVNPTPSSEKLNNNDNYSCTLMDVTAPTLRTIDLKGYNMVGDHTAAAYTAALDALVVASLKQEEGDE